MIAALVIIFFAVSCLSSLSQSGRSTSSATTPAAGSPGSPCPAAVARWLSSDAVVVGEYRTAAHVITLCRTPDGQVHYDGQKNGAPVDDTNHISLPAMSTAEGFIAQNGDYGYEIRGGVVIVTKGTEVLSTTPLQSGS